MKTKVNRRHFIITLGAGIAASQLKQATASDLADVPATGCFLPPFDHKDQFTPLHYEDIKIGGEIGRRIDITANNNILKIDIDKDFLYSFVHKDTSDGGFVGVGKLLEATVRLAAYTGDKQMITLKEHLVRTLIEAQEPDGYMGNMKSGNRIKRLWDIHEIGYIIYGLIYNFRLFGDKKSLESAQKASNYLIKNWYLIDSEWEKSTNVGLHVGITGIQRTMLTLYEVTKDEGVLDFCLTKLRIREWNPGIVIGRKNLIYGHIYGYMAASLAQLELYRILGNQELTQPTKLALDFLTTGNGMTVSGGAGQVEIWTDDQDGRGELGETCATAYQIRVYESLLRLSGESIFGDLIERTMYNALFGAQSPDGRQLRYFTPLEGNRKYHNTDTYCCPNNYRRIIAELPLMVYYRNGNGIVINQFTESTAKIDMDGFSIHVRQETNYPNTGLVIIRVNPERPSHFHMKMRIPGWCQSSTIRVNKEPATNINKSMGYFEIDRLWANGDTIEVNMEMDWRLIKGVQKQAGRVAVMRGPVVFCLNPDQNKQLSELDGADLGRLVIDYESIAKEAVPDRSVRPDGIGCSLEAGNTLFAMGNSRNLSLVLTEFPDPLGKCTYFITPEIGEAIPDELTLKNPFN